MAILVRLAWRNLWRHAGRTALTASGTALGLGLLLVMLGLGDGSHAQMIDAAARMGSGHVLLQAPGYQERRRLETALSPDLAARAALWARSRSGVRVVVPRAFASGLLSSADGATGLTLVGVDPSAERVGSRFALRIAGGRFLQMGDGNAVVVGSEVARLLRARVGSRVVAMAQTAAGGEVRSVLLHVVGVMHTGLEELDQGTALIPLTTLQGFLALDGQVHQLALLLDDQTRAATVARDALEALPQLDALTWAQADPQLEAAIRMDDGGHYLFNSLFFVIIGFMVLNTLLMSALERRREFALLGALGVSPRRRLAMVLLEGCLLGSVAVAGGLALGLGAHTYFRLHGLPLAWFTREEFETGGVLLEPIMYSSLSAARIAGSASLVLGLMLILTLVAARQAAKPVDVTLLK